MISLNLQLFTFALGTLKRYLLKNVLIVLVYTLLVMLLATLFFIQAGMKAEVQKSLYELPDIVIQNQKALRYTTIDDKNLEKILDIYGVSDVSVRVYGEYKLKNSQNIISIIGIDPYENQKESYLIELLYNNELQQGEMFLSQPLKKLFATSYYEDYFNFINPSLEIKKVAFKTTFQPQTMKQDLLCVMLKEDAKEVLGYSVSEFTDIAITLSNSNELVNIVAKLQQIYPNAKIITKEDEESKVQILFDYNSGIFISLFIIALFTFFMIVLEKTSGISSAEKKEIGILKALGWRIEDVLKVKLYEGAMISFISYSIGVLLAIFYILIFEGYYIKDIFSNLLALGSISNFPLVIDFQGLVLLFLLSVPVYIAATIIPSWKIATQDADEVMR